jgi:hypothetical protein
MYFVYRKENLVNDEPKMVISTPTARAVYPIIKGRSPPALFPVS